MMRGKTLKTGLVAVTAAGLALSMSACGNGGEGTDGDGGEASGSITVWTLESLPDRMNVTEEIAAAFTEETGVEVELVGIEEAQAPQLIQSSALSGDLPDVAAAFPLGMVHEMNNNQMVDKEAAAQIIENLGQDTFQAMALELMQAEGEQIGVPSDGWSQILMYRTDHFEEAGLEPPTTYEALVAAAQALNKDGQFGITLATDPSDVFTQQTFEAIALGNSCELVDESGAVTMDSENCKAAFQLYKDLADNSPAGAQTVDSTRAAYFNGSASMTLWSTYILDELAGLRDDALPACPECADNPEFLAENTGVVVNIEGPNKDGDVGSYGEVTGFVPIDGGNTEAATAFIEYMMSDGYEQWLAMAPEGKFPMRTGDADDMERFSNAWGEMEAGVDRRAPLGDFYSEEVIDTLTNMGDNIDRWALPQGQGALLGSFTAELPLSKAISEMASGGMTVDEAVAEVTAATREMIG